MAEPDDVFADQPEHHAGQAVQALASAVGNLLILSQDEAYCKLLRFSMSEIEMAHETLAYVIVCRLNKYRREAA